MFFFQNKERHRKAKEKRKEKAQAASASKPIESLDSKFAASALRRVPVANLSDRDHVLGMEDVGTALVFDKTVAPQLGQNILLFGRPMSGKTVSFLTPDIRRMISSEESLIISDPDGDLYSVVVDAFYIYGYDVRVLDLRDVSRSDKWSLLEGFNNIEDVTVVQKLASNVAKTFVPNLMTDPDSEVSHAFESLITAVVMRVCMDPDYDTSFGTVCSLLTQCVSEQYADEIFNSDVLDGDLRACLGPYNVFRQQRMRSPGEITRIANQIIGPIAKPEIQEIFSGNDFNFASAATGEHPVAYFVITTKGDNKYRAITALFIRMAYARLLQLNRSDFVRPVNVVLDGLQDVGYVPGLDGVLLSGVRQQIPIATTVALQKLSELRDRYPAEWKQVILNFFVQMSFGFSDESTAQYYSAVAATALAKDHTGKKKRKDPVADSKNDDWSPLGLLQASLDEEFIVLKGAARVKCVQRSV